MNAYSVAEWPTTALPNRNPAGTELPISWGRHVLQVPLGWPSRYLRQSTSRLKLQRLELLVVVAYGEDAGLHSWDISIMHRKKLLVSAYLSIPWYTINSRESEGHRSNLSTLVCSSGSVEWIHP